ncbi:lycopene cyclase family protein [Aquimarina brevivitae]|uniref:Lycopene beta-cyclase n=1 Tax=Aquimarina brevivitae TaxID=323412 RepID=A0A4Q7PG10_9FLAO|nr:lycopene cyclase family protein [Aquimarina brevivitae]RZS99097.1 lycopene beta-cyclase [Aquimarina brevivitae]
MIKNFDYIISGSGAAGLMLAYRMIGDRFFEDKKILLLDSQEKDKDDRTWCFWDSKSGPFEDIVSKNWDYINFKSDQLDKRFDIRPFSYKHISSLDFYEKTLAVIKSSPQITQQYERVEDIQDQGSFVEVITNKEKYKATKVINSIPFDQEFNSSKRYPLLQQHFIGWFVKTSSPQFDDSVATFMDFSIPQSGNTRFIYVLPFAKDMALIEYTLFSKELLSKEEYEEGIKAYLAQLGIEDYEIVRKEGGCIPMSCYKFWKNNSDNILHIGTAGGWTKASTGYTFRNTIKKTSQLIPFIKSEKPLRKFVSKNRFWFYDLLFLDYLYANNSKGGMVFSRMFEKNHSSLIFRFLDEETSFIEELKIMSSMPTFTFTKLFFKRVWSELVTAKK